MISNQGTLPYGEEGATTWKQQPNINSPAQLSVKVGWMMKVGERNGLPSGGGERAAASGQYQYQYLLFLPLDGQSGSPFRLGTVLRYVGVG